MNLYQITQEQLNLTNSIIESEGEITEKTALKLFENEQALKEKSEGIRYVCKTYDAEIEIINEEIKRLQALKKAKENAVKRLKRNILFAMKIFNVKKIEFATGKISIRKSKSVVILDENAIPDKYCIWEKKIYKSSIKKDLEVGNISGAKLSENENVQIC